MWKASKIWISILITESKWLNPNEGLYFIHTKIMQASNMNSPGREHDASGRRIRLVKPWYDDSGSLPTTSYHLQGAPCCMAAHLGSADAWAGIASDLVAFPEFLLDRSQAVKCRYGWDMSLCQRETDSTGMHGLRMCIKDYSIRCRIKVLSLSCGSRISPPSILPTLLA